MYLGERFPRIYAKSPDCNIDDELQNAKTHWMGQTNPSATLLQLMAAQFCKEESMEKCFDNIKMCFSNRLSPSRVKAVFPTSSYPRLGHIFF